MRCAHYLDVLWCRDSHVLLEQPMNPYVKTVRPLDGFRLEVLFESGEHRIFDVQPYLYRGAFVRLQNRALFEAVRVVAGSVEWPGGLDFSYDTLYLESQPVAEPAMVESASA
jgi:hypothetical protein